MRKLVTRANGNAQAGLDRTQNQVLLILNTEGSQDGTGNERTGGQPSSHSRERW